MMATSQRRKMIKQPAKVIAETPNRYIIETLPQSGCPRCEAGNGCGGGILAKAFANKTYRLEVTKSEKLNINELIHIGLASSLLVKGSFIHYMMPLILMILGATIFGYFTQNQDLYTVIGSILGFLTGIFFARLVSAYSLSRELSSPVIIRDENNCWHSLD